MRIDHILLSTELAPRLVAAEVDREVRGYEKASDHAPVWVMLSKTAWSRRL
jgi:exodeoxyribonuclease-3